MNMKKLLTEMYRIDEAEFTPDYQQAFQSSTPTMSQTAYNTAPVKPTGQAPEGHVNPNQSEIDKNNLLQQLFTLLKSLTVAKTPKTEGLSNIAKGIMEAFNIIGEAELSNTGEIAKINAQIDDVMNKLSQYKNDSSVQDAFRRVKQIRAADYSLAKPYTPSDAAPETSAKSAAKPAAKPAVNPTAKPAAKPTTGSSSGQGVLPYAPSVAAMQDALNTAGAKIAVDGRLGPETREAMKKFPQIVAGYKLPNAVGASGQGIKTATPISTTTTGKNRYNADNAPGTPIGKSDEKSWWNTPMF